MSACSKDCVPSLLCFINCSKVSTNFVLQGSWVSDTAVAVASSVTRWAIRIMRLCWDSPVLPQPVCHGRVRLHGGPSNVRLRALPAALAEVGLAAPGLSGHGSRLASVKHLRNAPPGSVYIGRGFQKLGLKKSDFCNPFRIGPDGDRTAVVAKFRSWICRQPALLKRLPELGGRLLLCHCEPGEPCHGQVLLQLLSRMDAS